MNRITLPDSFVKIDAGLFPLCNAAKVMPQFMLWCMCHNRSAASGGRLPLSEVYELALARGWSRRRVQQIIADGADLFWGRGDHVLWLRTEARLWESLSERVSVELFEDARPGLRFVYINPFTSMADFKGQLFKGWVQTRSRSRSITISREKLGREIFDVHPDTTRQWQASGRVEALHNYVQVGKDFPVDLLPQHAYPIKTLDGSDGYTWRDPNTYIAGNELSEHPKSGKLKQVRILRNRLLAKLKQRSRTTELTDLGLHRADLGQSHSIPRSQSGQFVNERIYFEGENRKDGEQQARSWLRKMRDRVDEGVVRRIFWERKIGRRRDIAIWTCYHPGDPLKVDHRDFKNERTLEFELYRAGFVDQAWEGAKLFRGTHRARNDSYTLRLGRIGERLSYEYGRRWGNPQLLLGHINRDGYSRISKSYEQQQPKRRLLFLGWWYAREVVIYTRLLRKRGRPPTLRAQLERLMSIWNIERMDSFVYILKFKAETLRTEYQQRQQRRLTA